jgi:hypothetical protein
MDLLFFDNGAVQAGSNAAKAAPACFSMADQGMFMEGQVHPAQGMIRASFHTLPASQAEAGVQPDETGFGHFYIHRGVRAW